MNANDHLTVWAASDLDAVDVARRAWERDGLRVLSCEARRADDTPATATGLVRYIVRGVVELLHGVKP